MIVSNLRDLAKQSAEDFIDKVQGPTSGCGFSDQSDLRAVRAWYPEGYIEGYRVALNALKKANEGFEKYERLYYLEKDKSMEREAELLAHIEKLESI